LIEPLLAGYLLAIGAASATLIGVLIITLRRALSERILAFILLLVAGAMITVSLGQILPTSFRSVDSPLRVVLFFLVGVLAVLVLARIDVGGGQATRSLWVTVIAITLHNLPEGATPIGATLIDLDTGITTAIVLALHNIPEGIAIATMARLAGIGRILTAFLVGIAAMAEIAGASVVYFFGSEMSDDTTSLILAAVAGIMVTISAKELIPYSARILLASRKR
jgi:zinc transporter, ZIP family